MAANEPKKGSPLLARLRQLRRLRGPLGHGFKRLLPLLHSLLLQPSFSGAAMEAKPRRPFTILSQARREAAGVRKNAPAGRTKIKSTLTKGGVIISDRLLHYRT